MEFKLRANMVMSKSLTVEATLSRCHLSNRKNCARSMIFGSTSNLWIK